MTACEFDQSSIQRDFRRILNGENSLNRTIHQ